MSVCVHLHTHRRTHNFFFLNPSIQDKNISKWLTPYLKFMFTENNRSPYDIFWRQRQSIRKIPEEQWRGIVIKAVRIAFWSRLLNNRSSLWSSTEWVSVSRMTASHLSHTSLFIVNLYNWSYTPAAVNSSQFISSLEKCFVLTTQ